MDWKALLNPWGCNRQLRERAAYLEGRLDEVAERAEEAEGRAFRRASEHYYIRMRQIEAQNEHLIKQMTDIANLTPRPIVFRDAVSFMNASQP
jgi:DNA-binding ferritin-like protein